MNIMVLHRNNKYEYYDNVNKKILNNIKSSKIKLVLVETHHAVFGKFYVGLKPKLFKKLVSFKNFVLSYRFLDGILIDDDDQYLFVKNKYWYNSLDKLYSKLIEIYINENIFNDSFWIYDSFFQFIYDKLKLKLKKKKSSKIFGSNIYNKLFESNKILDKLIINLKNNNWKSTNKIDYKSESLIQVYDNIYFRIDSKIFKTGKHVLNSKICLINEDYVLNERESILKLNKANNKKLNIKDIFNLRLLLEIYVSKYVICTLESYDDYDTYYVKTKIKNINKKRFKFGKFIRKFFVDIEKY